jgi:hypothetical protein
MCFGRPFQAIPLHLHRQLMYLERAGEPGEPRDGEACCGYGALATRLRHSK